MKIPKKCWIFNHEQENISQIKTKTSCEGCDKSGTAAWWREGDFKPSEKT